MRTGRAYSKREAERKQRLAMLESGERRRQTLKDPKEALNSDQAAMRRVLEYDFFGNRELMGEAIGMTSAGIAKYVVTAESSPDWDLMSRVAEVAHITIDQLRAEGAGHGSELFIASTGEWIDPTSPEWETQRLKLIAWAACDPNEEIDL